VFCARIVRIRAANPVFINVRGSRGSEKRRTNIVGASIGKENRPLREKTHSFKKVRRSIRRNFRELPREKNVTDKLTVSTIGSPEEEKVLEREFLLNLVLGKIPDRRSNTEYFLGSVEIIVGSRGGRVGGGGGKGIGVVGGGGGGMGGREWKRRIVGERREGDGQGRTGEVGMRQGRWGGGERREAEEGRGREMGAGGGR